MKHFRIVLLMVLVLLFSVTALAEQGPNIDKIYFNARMQEDIAIQDVAEGKSDIFFYGLEGPHIMGLNQSTLNKLDMYSVPAGYWSLILNPIPNKAPYTWTVDGKEYFNPFAIREVRFALNYLINRQYIVDEIVGGHGGPMFSVAIPGQPGTYKFDLIASRMGLTAEGDEARALKDIEEAMQKAAALPHNKGRLKKEGKWWTFDGEPVSIKFIIRVDDPQGRLKEGEYIAQQIEKAGIKVERLLWDRYKASTAVYGGNPANYEYHLYTEGWFAGGTRKYWGVSLAQMTASWYGFMPGNAIPENWNYVNDRIEVLTKKIMTGNFLTEDEYWNITNEVCEKALNDSVRIFVCYQDNYYVTNKERFNRRMTYGIGDALNKYSLVSADVKGEKVLHCTQYASQGSLFMSHWDPVGASGFTDMYIGYIANPLTDWEFYVHQANADFIPVRSIPFDIETKVVEENGELKGQLDVPADAITYDPVENKWVKVDTGLKSFSKSSYKYRFSNFHHGQPMSLVDYLYGEAFKVEWATQDHEGDPYYDPQYSAYWSPVLDTIKGYIFDFENETTTAYFDYNFPADELAVAFYACPTWSTTACGNYIGVCWEISEALSRLVVDGSESGTVYSFSMGKEGTTQVDVLNKSCVEDIRSELLEMIEEQHVPDSIKDFITPQEAVKRYQAAVEFIDNYGHAYISNGPFYMAKYDPEAMFVELRAFRDPTYPFKGEEWYKMFKQPIVQIEEITVPAMEERGNEIMVVMNVSKLMYPETETAPANAKEAKAKAILVVGENELEFAAKSVSEGVFIARIPAEVTKDLEPGSYVIVGMAEMENCSPATSTTRVIIY